MAQENDCFRATHSTVKTKVAQDILTTREPGGVAISEHIRELILDINHTAMDPKTELLLYIAARRQHLVEKVLPALEAGQLVLLIVSSIVQ